jgi:hypothetical protein
MDRTSKEGRIYSIAGRERRAMEDFERLLKVQGVIGTKNSRKRKDDGRDFERLFIEQGLIVKISGF